MKVTTETSASLEVLIETYWNVNELAVPGWARMLTVLIETYWNVNVSDSRDLCSFTVY